MLYNYFMEKKENKLFYIFLLINTILWSLISTIRYVPSIDTMEAISWGELISFGTNKHPPLSGWLASGVYHLGGNHDFFVYLLGQLCILTGFIFIYKLAKFFLSNEKAIASAMILEGCYYYTFDYFIDNFNCNFLLMALWPMVIYYFYKSIKENRLSNWILFGISSGFAFLGKYQIVFLFLALGIYLVLCEREKFKQKGMYIAILSGLVIILPHIIWLFNNEFFSFGYMLERTHANANNVPVFLEKLGHIFFPIKFILGQLMAAGGCIFIFLMTALQAKNISFNKSQNKNDNIFLLLIFFIPILAQGLMGMITGERVPSIWGSIMVCTTGLTLFYFFPIEFNTNTFKVFVKWIYAAMSISILSTLIFALVQTKQIMFYPVEKVMNDFNTIWNENTNNAPLKYVGGDIKYIFQFRQYNNQHPKVILETYGHQNPWIKQEDLSKSGALIIISPKIKDKENFVKELVPNVSENITFETYNFEFCNIFGKCREKEFCYSIIKPHI